MQTKCAAILAALMALVITSGCMVVQPPPEHSLVVTSVPHAPKAQPVQASEEKPKAKAEPACTTTCTQPVAAPAPASVAQTLASPVVQPAVQAPAPQDVVPQGPDPRSPFIAAAPAGHNFVGATRSTGEDACEKRGGTVVPDTSKPIKTAKGWAYRNKCSK